MSRTFSRCVVWALPATLLATAAHAQAPATAAPAEVQAQTAPAQHDHPQMAAGWQFMQDGVVFGTFTDQTGVRANRQFRSQNWWMLMAQRPAAGGTLSASLMLSLDPITVGDRGYDELFQLGEASFGEDFFGVRTLLANVDRQHPHDFLMQASLAWERPITERFGVVLAGAPVGEAALGPVAFMHRASGAENPIAPLSHHTFDATHITMGVLTAGLTYGPWMIESSVFQGREPDENRWDLMDPGALDSWSARLSFRAGGWHGQVSHGDIEKPERLENIDVRRTTGSISWTRVSGEDFTSVSVIGGQNRRPFSTLRAFLVEATDHRGRLSLYGRFEAVDVESEHLFFPLVVHVPHPGELVDKVKVGTIGAVYDVLRVKGFTLGAGADIQFYGLTERLEDFYGRPRTAHVFFRLRTPLPRMGRMFDMTMTSHPHGGM
jgi:hypothetical protein